MIRPGSVAVLFTEKCVSFGMSVCVCVLAAHQAPHYLLSPITGWIHGPPRGGGQKAPWQSSEVLKHIRGRSYTSPPCHRRPILTSGGRRWRQACERRRSQHQTTLIKAAKSEWKPNNSRAIFASMLRSFFFPPHRGEAGQRECITSGSSSSAGAKFAMCSSRKGSTVRAESG